MSESGIRVAILGTMHRLRSDRFLRARRAAQTAVALLFCLSLASPILAQTARVRTPDKGVIGYGVDGGVLFPDEAFENTFTFDGFGEYYVSPRVGIRGLLAFAKPGVAGATEDNFRQVKLLFSGVYNWEKGSWRPFAQVGAGFYFVRQHIDATTDPPGETRGGLNFGGGGEYLLNNEAAIKIEMRWDVVSHPFLLPDATGITLTVGYKRYF
jgi:hypothetical protein